MTKSVSDSVPKRKRRVFLADFACLNFESILDQKLPQGFFFVLWKPRVLVVFRVRVLNIMMTRG